MNKHREIRLFLTTAAALGLSSCAVKDGRLDFTWWQDAAAPVMEDDVIIESGGGGYYRTTPAPSKVPAASIPKETAPPAPASSQPKQAAAQQQPALQEPPPPPKRKRTRMAAPQPTPGIHVVQPGDTLTALARRYGTTVNALVAANSMTNANVPLRINQQLKLPTATPAATPLPLAPIPVPPPAATPAVPKPAPAATPAAPAPAPKPAPAGGAYTIQPGDTIYKISRQYGVNPTALMQANGLTPETANTIRVGATLRIPAAN